MIVDPDILTLYLKCGVHPDIGDSKALITAVVASNMNVIKTLHEAHCDIHAHNEEALIQACIPRKDIPDTSNLVGLLLHCGAKAYARGNQPLMTSVEHDQYGAVKALLAYGANPRAQGDRAMLEAQRRGNMAILDLLQGPKPEKIPILLTKYDRDTGEYTITSIIIPPEMRAQMGETVSVSILGTTTMPNNRH
jgi:hypothetical protein